MNSILDAVAGVGFWPNTCIKLQDTAIKTTMAIAVGSLNFVIKNQFVWIVFVTFDRGLELPRDKIHPAQFKSCHFLGFKISHLYPVCIGIRYINLPA